MSKKSPDAFIVTKSDGDWDLIKASALNRYAIKSEDGSKQIEGEGWDYKEFYEPLYDPHHLLELLEVNTYHAQCVDVVARDSAGNGWTINNKADQTGSEGAKKRVKTFVEGLSPNLNKLFYQRTYDRRGVGYGALEIIRQGRSKSPAQRLDHLPSQHLRRHRDGFRVKQKIGLKEVWFVIYGKNKVGSKLVDVHCKTGEIYPYNSLSRDERANELLWQMDYTPKSKYYGLAKIVPAIPAIHGDTSRSIFNTAFFKNYGMPAFAVTVSGDFEDYDKEPGDDGYDETKTLRYKISKQIKEVMKNPHSAVTILVPSEGEEGNVEIKLQPLSIETKEASFRLYRKDNRDEVIAAHRVPMYRLGINETGSLGGSNSRDSTEIYKNSIVEPIQTDDEADIQQLIEEFFPGTPFKFEMNEIDVRDAAADMTIAKDLFDRAAMTPNELRNHFGERFGLKESDNPYLDEFYLHGVPLDNVWSGGNSTDPPGTNSVLDGLEDELIGEIEEEEVDDFNQTDDSLEGTARKNAFDRLTDRIRYAISSRKSTSR